MTKQDLARLERRLAHLTRTFEFAVAETEEECREALRADGIEPTLAGEAIVAQVERLARATGRPPDRRRMMDLHDGIGNPLEIVIGYAEILLEGSVGPLNEIQRSLLLAVVGYARTLTSEIHTCLDLLEVGTELPPPS